MLVNAAVLNPEMELEDAMRRVVNLHFPVYPVCDAERRLVGLVRGHVLFEEHRDQRAGRLDGRCRQRGTPRDTVDP